MSKPIVKEPIELDKFLEDGLMESQTFINFSKILKEYIDYLHYLVGENIKTCSKIKWLDKRYDIERQEKDLLFELENSNEYLKNTITRNLPCIEKVEIKFEVRPSSGCGQGDIIKVKDLVRVNIFLEFFQPKYPTSTKKSQKYELEFNYYLNLESEKGWH